LTTDAFERDREDAIQQHLSPGVHRPFLEHAGRDLLPFSASASRAARGNERETRRTPALVRVSRRETIDGLFARSFLGYQSQTD
jgi:hypothetical protein